MEISHKLTQNDRGGRGGVCPKITEDNDKGGVRKELVFIVPYNNPVMEINW